MKKFTKRDFLVFAGCAALAIYAVSYNQQIVAQNQIYFPRPLSDDDIKLYKNSDLKAVVIYPIFTQIAYKDGGFYDYYNKTCNSCSTVSMNPLEINATYTSGLSGFEYLTQLHYPFITDIMVDKHPEVLKEYNKIILLHNEYMTKNEFNAIKNHSNVLYLYPNNMYVEIAVDYDKSTISLVRGHGYPQSDIKNGFGYVTSSNHEYDLNCKQYKWEERPNGMEITCWPEFLIKSDRSLLQTIKDFPQKIPPLVTESSLPANITSIPICDLNGKCPTK